MSIELKNELEKIGLSKHEAQVYAVLLEHSPTSASYIAKTIRLSRSTVYTILNTLLSKSLIGTTHKNNIKQFAVLEPDSLEHFLDREKESLQKKIEAFALLKEKLQTFSVSSLRIPTILFVEGQEGLKKIYADMMRQAPKNSTLYLLRDEFIWDQGWDFIFTRDWHARIKRFKQEKNLVTKLLINDSALERDKDNFYASKQSLAYRYLPPKNSVKGMALYILNDTICLLSMEQNNLIGIQIINAALAKNVVQLFEILWNAGRTPKKQP